MKKALVFGTFDLLHLGHISLFTQAKKQADHVTVVVARDARVKELKKKETIHTEKERVTLLKHIRIIDEVVLGDKTNVYKMIKKIRPDVIVLGYDQVHYVDGLAEKLKEFNLKTKIVRAKPLKETRYKSGLIRKRI